MTSWRWGAALEYLAVVAIVVVLAIVSGIGMSR